MIDWLIGIDTKLFIFFNVSLANPILDFTMPAVTNDWVLRVAFLMIITSLMIFGKNQGRVAALLLVISVILSDQMSSHLIKPLIGRIRPCHVVPNVHLLVNCTQGLSFPSSHAANAFAPAVLASFIYRKHVWWLLAIAGVVAYSRIAVGVHYPFDVLFGAIVGLLCGVFVAVAYRFTASKFGRARAAKGL